MPRSCHFLTHSIDLQGRQLWMSAAVSPDSNSAGPQGLQLISRHAAVRPDAVHPSADDKNRRRNRVLVHRDLAFGLQK